VVRRLTPHGEQLLTGGSVRARSLELMSDDEPPPQPDGLDSELDRFAHEPLRVETVDPATGERRLEADLAQAIVERYEL
jgi:hypothetical protein